jgi:hypothetical protein
MAGAPITTPTPIPFGGLQEGTVEFSGNIKELFGMNQFALIALPGQKKITGKAKAGVISAEMLNIFFGETPTVGQILIAKQEAATIPSSGGPHTVANGTTFTVDLGVSWGPTDPNNPMMPLKCVAGPTPATGQYSVGAGGEYTFAAADVGKSVLISYSYTTAAAPGAVIPILNHPLGTGLFFMVVLNMLVVGKSLTLVLNQCVSNKLSMGTKLEDFEVPEMDFQAMDPGTGIIGSYSFNN